MVDTYACGIEMHRPEGDLYDILEVPRGSDFVTCGMHGNHRRKSEDFSADVRYAWKALSDPYYNALYNKTRTTEALYDAGFFDDGLEKLVEDYLLFDTDFSCVSDHKLVSNYNEIDHNTRNVAVLFTTGGMAPIHNGHIAMMENARKQLEDKGFSVVAGYFCPGHDSYVSKKYNGTAAISAADRCAMVELAVQDSDWLSCDPWAARYMPAEINFTDIYRRFLKQYSGPVQIFYVHGSDNAGFSAALPGHTVMVERSNISSKAVREGNLDHLDPKVREYFEGIGKTDTGELPYLIRNEEDMTVGHWERYFESKEVLDRRRLALQNAIRLGFAQLFKLSGMKNKVHLLDVTKQISEAKKVIGDQKTISLDPFFSGTYRIDSTRYFTPYGPQYKPLYRAARPGAEELADQFDKIPEGEYLLVEDDTVTGETINAVRNNLPPSVKIKGQVILSDFADYAGTEYYDVVDLRDFIVGSKHGGLSVILPDKTRGRVPYILPFVNLQTRAKVPANIEMELSRIIWQANITFFKKTGIKIIDCNIGFANFAYSSGWDPEDTVEDFCQKQLDYLLETASA